VRPIRADSLFNFRGETPVAITPEDLINKSFKVVNVGPSYSMNEVDDFLDELVGELRRLNAENNSLRRKLEDCESRKGGASTSEAAAAAAPAGGSQDAAGLLAMAQKVHDDYVSQGERTKAELIAEAEKKANQLVVEAEIKREKALSALKEEQANLKSSVESLRGFESRYRTQLQEHLNRQLDDLRHLKSIEAEARY
jgi:hypothetical protein